MAFSIRPADLFDLGKKLSLIDFKQCIRRIFASADRSGIDHPLSAPRFLKGVMGMPKEHYVCIPCRIE